MREYKKPICLELKIEIEDLLLVSTDDGNILFDETFIDEEF